MRSSELVPLLTMWECSPKTISDLASIIIMAYELGYQSGYCIGQKKVKV